MSRASRLDTYLRDHTRTYPHAKTVAYLPQHLAVSVSTLLLSACNQGDDAPKPAAVAPQPAAPSMAALSIPLCLNGQCAVIDQDAKLLVPFDNDYDNIVASAYQGTLMAAREERWNLIQAKDGKVLRDDIGEALSLLTPNLYGFVRDGKYGVVDGQGKEVQAPRFDDIYPNSANEFIIYEIDGKRGILDAKGKQLTEALYDTTLVNGSVAEHGGLISAERGEEKWIINLATGEQKAVAYESLGDLHDGVMSASVIGKGSQLVDAKGDVVGDGKSYDYLGTPANGLVAFREKYDSPCGYLDYQGKVVIAAQFAGCGAFGKQGGLAQQRMEDGSSGKYGLIDRSGAWKVQPQYDSARQRRPHRAWLHRRRARAGCRRREHRPVQRRLRHLQPRRRQRVGEAGLCADRRAGQRPVRRGEEGRAAEDRQLHGFGKPGAGGGPDGPQRQDAAGAGRTDQHPVCV